jgi:PPOX class probable F420-dependent enzyme
VIEMAMTEARGRGMTPEERNEFLFLGAKFAKLATTTEDGWPTVSPVWYEWDGSSFLVVGKERTGYVRNLRRDPRCGVLVENPGLPYARVSVLAVAEFLPDDFDWTTPAHRMVLRYIGKEGLDYAKATFDSRGSACASGLGGCPPGTVRASTGPSTGTPSGTRSGPHRR